MKLLMYCTISFSLLALGSFASADKGQKEQKGSEIQSLSFDGMRGACKDPARYHNQISPSNIQVSCRDVQYKWVQAEDGSFGLNCQRQVTAAVMSDKYSVSPQTFDIKATDQSASCPRFKRIVETVTFTKNATCEELLAFTGTAADYCSGLVNNLRADNPQSIQVQDAGEYVDTCHGVKAVEHGQKGQR